MLRQRLLSLALLLCVVTTFGLAGCESMTFTTATTVSEGQTDASEGNTEPTVPLASASLVGAGASFPDPVYVGWIGGFREAHPQVAVDYTAVGSDVGIEQLTAQRLDFCGTDYYMDIGQIASAEAAHPGTIIIQVPTVMGAVVLAYNLPGVQGLRLDSDTIVDIFLGDITQWDDPAIVTLNPDAALPDTNIMPVYRPDPSGTTYTFTSYLSQVSPEWADQVGSGKKVQWPTGVLSAPSDDMAATITDTEDSIGYVELADALLNDMSVADIENASGNFITPTLESTAAAVTGAEVMPHGLRVDVLDSSDPDAYPIVSITYVAFYDKLRDADKAEALKSFLTWGLGPEGSELAEALGYATLPDSIRDKALRKVALIEE